jgi:hypothetical protein
MRKLLLILLCVPLMFSCGRGECEECTKRVPNETLKGMDFIFTEKVCRGDFDSDEAYEAEKKSYDSCKKLHK